MDDPKHYTIKIGENGNASGYVLLTGAKIVSVEGPVVTVTETHTAESPSDPE